jgi:SPP1 family predicted phage head-tail adaptor
MNPGRLKHRIEIQEKKTIKDPVTKLPTETFVTVYSCWAEIEQPTGRRFFEAAVAHLEYAVFFHIRYCEGIKPGMYVKFGDTTYLIEQVRPDLHRKRTTTLQCKEVV